MDSQHQNGRNKDEEKKNHDGKLKQGSKEASPPSPSSSPSHEFSFTISLQPSSTTSTTTAAATNTKTATNNNTSDKAKSSPASFALDLSPASFALDLSPADEIFFHGHLLPLHLLSHLPVSPRSSTNSLDSFTLPIKEIHQNHENINNNVGTHTSKVEKSIDARSSSNKNNNLDRETRGRTKPKSFSLFGFSSKRQKENIKGREKDEKERERRKLKFNISQVLKRYMRMVRPILSSLSSRGRGKLRQIHRETYSYSGNLSLRRKPEIRVGRGEFSAPASMRTSPTNSGLLVANNGNATLSTHSSTSDSTMEELQAAIQAAIAHCKNSIATEEKIKCND